MSENKEPIPVRTEYHFQPGDVVTFPDEPEAAGRRFVVMRGSCDHDEIGQRIDCGKCDVCYLAPADNSFLDCETSWGLLHCGNPENPIYFKEIEQDGDE